MNIILVVGDLKMPCDAGIRPFIKDSIAILVVENENRNRLERLELSRMKSDEDLLIEKILLDVVMPKQKVQFSRKISKMKSRESALVCKRFSAKHGKK